MRLPLFIYYSSIANIKLETTTEKKAKIFKCKICNAGLKSKQGLDIHVIAIHENIKAHQCPNCEYKTPRSFDLTKHINNQHKKKKKPKEKVKCLHCKQVFTRNFSMKKHIEAVHEGIKTFCCTTCGHKFSTKHGLKIHIEGIHTVYEGKKPHQCTDCDYDTTYKADLKKHIKNRHG